MRIRLQILLGVAPVFLVLGLVVGALNYTTGLEETRLALREEVYTLTVSLSEFLSSERVRLVLSDPTAARGLLQEPLMRLMQDNPIRHIALRPLDRRQSSAEFGEVLESRPDLLGSRAGLEAQGDILFSLVIEPGGQHIVRALAPLHDSGSPFGLLILDIDATRAVEAERTILMHSLAFLFGILGCGILVSVIAGRLVTGAASQLNQATEVVASGSYDWRVQPSRLREFNDLGNTFNTMTSLLEEILSKTKRAVIEGEQFRRPEDLADCFSESLWQIGHTRLGSLGASLIRLGRPGNGDFLALWKEHNRARIAMGRLLVSGAFDAAVMASAAFALVQEEIRIGEPGFSRAQEIFHFKFWDLVLWDAAEPNVEVWTYRFGQAEAAHRQVRITAEQGLTLHSLEGEWARRLDLYVRILQGMDDHRLMQELAGVLKEPAGGVILLTSAPLSA